MSSSLALASIGAGLLALASLGLGPPVLPGEGEVSGTPGTGDEARLDLALSWVAPADCGDVSSVQTRVHRLAPELTLGGPGSPARVQVEARVVREVDAGWIVTLRIEGAEDDERSFVAESCAVAIDATALVLAVAVDPVMVAQQLEAKPELEPELEPEPPAQLEPEPLAQAEAPREIGLILNLPAEPSPPVSPGLRFGLALLGGGGYGPLAAGALDLGLRLAVFGRRWRAELRGLWLPPLRASLGERGQARVDAFTVGARGCGVLHAGPFEFPLCGGLAGGAIRALALAPINNAEQATQPLVGLELSAGLTWVPLERLALGLELEAVGHLVSGGFALDDQSVLSNPPVGVRALAGLEIRLP